MNLVEATITKVTSEPYALYGKWWVDVEYNSWGQPGKTSIMFNHLEDAKKVEVGYTFLI